MTAHEMINNVACVVAGAVDVARVAAVLKRLSNDIQTGYLRHATTLPDGSVWRQYGKVQPGEMRLITGR